MNVTSPYTAYVSGQGYLGHLPGYEAPAVRRGGGFQAQVKEQTVQQAAGKTEREPSPNGPGLYDPEALESFERRELDEDTLEELAAKFLKKYNPTHMTQEEYDSFLDDLVEEGILSKNELGVLGYHGIIVMGSISDEPYCGATTVDTKNPNWDTYFSRYGYAKTFEELGGNTLAYAMMQVLWSKDPVGSSQFVKQVEAQTSAYSAMAKVLEAMDRQR